MFSEFFKQEAIKSCIPLDLMAKNAKDLTNGDQCFEHLFYSDRLERTNTGRLAGGYLSRYSNLAAGGIWFNGYNLEGGYNSLWGKLKPKNPRTDGQGKKVKYENPPKGSWEEMGIFFPIPTNEIFENIVKRQNKGVNQINFNCLYSEDESKDNEITGDQWIDFIKNHYKGAIAIVEGAKKALSVLNQGLPCIGIDSLWSFGIGKGKEKKLRTEIIELLENKEKCYLIVDNDDKQDTRNNVHFAVSQLGYLILENSQNIQLKICDWSSWSQAKGIDDLLYEYLLEGKSRAVFSKVIKEAKSFHNWLYNRSKNITKIVPNHFVNQRYLDIMPLLNQLTEKIICIKSPKDTGKTELIKSIVRDNDKKGIATYMMSHRQTLTRSICKRVGKPYKNEEIDEIYPLGFGLCIDSLRPSSKAKISASDLVENYLIIDEVTQTLAHLLNSSTCKKERLEIFKTLKEAVNNASKVIVLDADLDSNTIDFFRCLLDNQDDYFLIENTYHIKGYEGYFFCDNDPTKLINHCIASIKQGDKILILSDSQKRKSKFSTTNLETLIEIKLNRKAKILRIDQESLGDKDSPAFNCIKGLDNVIKNYDVVITSPSLGTGVSIDLVGHFDKVYGLFTGVLSCDDIRQFLIRLRDKNVPRYIFCQNISTQNKEGGYTDYKQVFSNLRQKTRQQFKALDINNIDYSNNTLDINFLLTYCKICATRNYSNRHLRQLLMDQLEEEGNIVFIYNDDCDKEEISLLKQEIKLNREENYDKEIEEIAKAEEITESDYQLLDRQETLTKKERHQLRKYKLQKTYKTEVKPELVRLDDNKGYYKLNNLYGLFNELENTKKSDLRFLEETRDNDLFLPDKSKRLNTIRVYAMKKMELDKFMVFDESQVRLWTNLDQDLIKFKQACIDNLYGIKNHFGITINDQWTPIRILNHILRSLFGLSLEFNGHKEGSQGDQQRQYYSCLIPDLYREVLDKWKERDATNQTDT